LNVDVRTLYRDLDFLRDCQVEIVHEKGRYKLVTDLEEACLLLPFPDPRLTLGQASVLAKGRSAIHGLLRVLVEQVRGEN
jgi:hypothetical protein